MEYSLLLSNLKIDKNFINNTVCCFGCREYCKAEYKSKDWLTRFAYLKKQLLNKNPNNSNYNKPFKDQLKYSIRKLLQNFNNFRKKAISNYLYYIYNHRHKDRDNLLQENFDCQAKTIKLSNLSKLNETKKYNTTYINFDLFLIFLNNFEYFCNLIKPTDNLSLEQKQSSSTQSLKTNGKLIKERKSYVVYSLNCGLLYGINLNHLLLASNKKHSYNKSKKVKFK